jgi:hypothetical protein
MCSSGRAVGYLAGGSGKYSLRDYSSTTALYSVICTSFA